MIRVTGRIATRVAAGLAGLLLTMSAVAEDETLTVAPERYVYCTVCHGVQLMGNDLLRAPRLSGMDAWYIENQLKAFKAGWRGKHPDDLVGMEMQPMAASLSDDEIAKAAKFVQSTESPLPATSVDGDASTGRRLYASCSACHGSQGEGNEALGAPALTGQNDWYLLHQLENYRDGRRGYVADDTLGLQMSASVKLLTGDDALRDVVSYISTLTPNDP